MNPVSRQDVQNIVEVARGRIMERMVTKQDLNLIQDSLKNILALHQQSQQLLKQSEYQRSQQTRRIVTLETRIASLENELRAFAGSVSRQVATQRPQQIIMPVQSQADEQALEQAAQYSYRPAY